MTTTVDVPPAASAPAVPVALLSPDPVLAERLRRVLQLPAGHDVRRWRDEHWAQDAAAVAADIAASGAGVVCLGPELPTPAALALAEAFDVAHPDVAVVLLAEPTTALWHGSLQVGVRGVVSPAAPDDELGGVVQSALTAAGRRRGAVSPAEARRVSRVIVVVSPKGGSGKTTVAVNLAAALARANPGGVALLDLDVQFGDVASSLHLAPEHTLSDVVAAPGGIDATSLKVHLTAHASGLWVLAAPDGPAEAEEVTAAHATRALELLAAQFQTVVVDTGAGLDELTLAAIERATDVVLVATMEVSAVRGLRKELAVLGSLGFVGADRHLVLNRADAKVGLHVGDVEDALGLPVEVALTGSRAVPVAVNQGLTLAESDPRAPITRQLDELARRFLPDATADRRAGGWLRRRKDAR